MRTGSRQLLSSLPVEAFHVGRVEHEGVEAGGGVGQRAAVDVAGEGEAGRRTQAGLEGDVGGEHAVGIGGDLLPERAEAVGDVGDEAAGGDVEGEDLGEQLGVLADMAAQ